jgi:ABC-2 type transport system permease protein
MRSHLRVVAATARLDLLRLARSRTVVVLTVLEAVTFLVLVSLFGITGSRAPTALVDEDGGPYAQLLASDLAAAHESFALQRMNADDAASALRDGQVTAVITIPANFTEEVNAGNTVAIPLDVDNVNVDLTDDVQRALPSAIAAFGHHLHLPQLRVSVQEADAFPHDTGYIPYLTVSALALDALVVAATLAAIMVARDGEVRTARVWRTSPASAAAVLAGRLGATAAVSLLAVAIAVACVVAGYRVGVQHPWEMAAGVLACVVIFTCVGAWIGAALRRTIAVVPLVFGLALPLWVDSGATEPARFDGEVIFWLAHASPVYYAVGLLEHAFHGLHVTPEPLWVDTLALLGFAAAGITLALHSLRRATVR